MSERWLRWYDGTVRDGKMRIVAELAEVPVCTVLGAWASLLEDAATSNPRGTATRGINYHAMYLQIAEGELIKIWNALERVGTVGTVKERDGTIHIVNWHKRQFETDDKDPTARDRKEKWKQRHKEVGTLRNVMERSRTPETETETETEKKVSRTAASAARPTDEEFENFKKAYPKRKGGNPWPAARKSLSSALRSGVEFETILTALRAGAGFDSEKIGTEFIPQASTWLNGRRWEDHATGPPEGVLSEVEQQQLWAKLKNGRADNPAGTVLRPIGSSVCEGQGARREESTVVADDQTEHRGMGGMATILRRMPGI